MILAVPYKTGLVTGRFLCVVADSPEDLDQEPEVVPMAGTVTFRPNVSHVKVTSGDDGPVTVSLAPITATIDSNGYLSRNGQRGIRLLASDGPTNPTGFSYQVGFSLSMGTTPVVYPEFAITVPAGESTDLTVAAPVTSTSGVAVTQGVGVRDVSVDNGEFVFHLTDGSTSRTPLPTLSGDATVSVKVESGGRYTINGQPIMGLTTTGGLPETATTEVQGIASNVVMTNLAPLQEAFNTTRATADSAVATAVQTANQVRELAVPARRATLTAENTVDPASPDIRAELQSALNAAANGGNKDYWGVLRRLGTRVTIAPGVYRVSAPTDGSPSIVVPRGVAFDFSGATLVFEYPKATTNWSGILAHSQAVVTIGNMKTAWGAPDKADVYDAIRVYHGDNGNAITGPGVISDFQGAAVRLLGSYVTRISGVRAEFCSHGIIHGHSSGLVTDGQGAYSIPTDGGQAVGAARRPTDLWVQDCMFDGTRGDVIVVGAVGSQDKPNSLDWSNKTVTGGNLYCSHVLVEGTPARAVWARELSQLVLNDFHMEEVGAPGGVMIDTDVVYGNLVVGPMRINITGQRDVTGLDRKATRATPAAIFSVGGFGSFTCRDTYLRNDLGALQFALPEPWEGAWGDAKIESIRSDQGSTGTLVESPLMRGKDQGMSTAEVEDIARRIAVQVMGDRIPDTGGDTGSETPAPSTAARRAVVLGTSHSDWFWSQAGGVWWWQTAADLAGLTIVDNFAVGGMTTRDALKGWSTKTDHPDTPQIVQAEKANADFAFVEFGGNDIAQGISADEFRANMTELVSRLQKAGKRVLVVAPPPLFADFNAQYGTQYRAYRKIGQEVAAALGAYQTDGWNTVGTGPSGSLPAKFDSGDGTHMNGDGQLAYGQAVAARVQEVAGVTNPYDGVRDKPWFEFIQGDTAAVSQGTGPGDALFQGARTGKIVSRPKASASEDAVIYQPVSSVAGTRWEVSYAYRVEGAAAPNSAAFEGLKDWPTGRETFPPQKFRLLGQEGVRRYEVTIPADATDGRVFALSVPPGAGALQMRVGMLGVLKIS